MIRYALAVVLATATLGVGIVAVEEAAKIRGESQIEAQLATVEAASLSMIEHDTPVREEQGPPQRVVEIELPEASLTSEPVDRLALEPEPELELTVARYRFEGRPERTVVLDGALVNATGDRDVIVLDGAAGSYTLELTYVRTDETAIRVRIR